MTARRRDVELANWPVAVLAGGLATRLRPATDKIPKALLRVAGEPFLVEWRVHARCLTRYRRSQIACL